MLFAVTYGIGCTAFLGLIILTISRRWPNSGTAWVVLGLYGVTALWALSAAFSQYWLPGLSHAAEGLKSWVWLQFLASMLLANRAGEQRTEKWLFRYILPALGLITLAVDVLRIAPTQTATDYSVLQMALRVILGALGVVMVENLARNTTPSQRWHTSPFALAMGMLFSYELFVFAEALFARHVDPALLAGLGLVLLVIAPLLVLTMVRNENWRIDLHVSRKVVFHSTTLILGGLFLLAAGTIASLVGQVPGTWGPMLRATFFSASILVLLVALSTESFRSRIRRFLFENFFSTRYDYRIEWAGFVDALSAAHDIDRLDTRAIRAIARLVDSPGGALWLEMPDGAFRLSAALNIAMESANSQEWMAEFIAGFESGQTIQLFPGGDRARLPAGLRDPRFWLALPLVRKAHVCGFVALLNPRAGMELDWESRDILKLLGRQVASYLSEEEATRSLAENAAILEYNRRFAFVVHDVKNLANQLRLTVENARHYIALPEFQADLISTIENSLERMDSLLARLRSDGDAPSQENCDAVVVAHTVLGDLAGGKVPVVLTAAGERAPVRIGGEALRSVFTHMLTNAVEASSDGDRIDFRIQPGPDGVQVEIRDTGCGMEADFVRDELFSPLHSTKRRGHGIGAYQARELVRASGGNLEVDSRVGQGTVVKIWLRPASRIADKLSWDAPEREQVRP